MYMKTGSLTDPQSKNIGRRGFFFGGVGGGSFSRMWFPSYVLIMKYSRCEFKIFKFYFTL